MSALVLSLPLILFHFPTRVPTRRFPFLLFFPFPKARCIPSTLYHTTLIPPLLLLRYTCLYASSSAAAAAAGRRF